MKCYECGKPASVIMDCSPLLTHMSGFLHVALCRKCLDKALKDSQKRIDARIKEELDQIFKEKFERDQQNKMRI